MWGRLLEGLCDSSSKLLQQMKATRAAAATGKETIVTDGGTMMCSPQLAFSDVGAPQAIVGEATSCLNAKLGDIKFIHITSSTVSAYTHTQSQAGSLEG